MKVKADVAALHIFSGDIDDAASGGVESCQGRPVLAFILTLDRSPRHFIIERGTKRNAVQLSFVPSLMGLGFCFCRTSNRSPPNLLRLRYCSPQEHKVDSRLSSVPRKTCRRHPHLPCFYPHSEWATSGPRCMLGFDLKPRSVTAVTDLGC